MEGAFENVLPLGQRLVNAFLFKKQAVRMSPRVVVTVNVTFASMKVTFRNDKLQSRDTNFHLTTTQLLFIMS